MVSLGQKLKNAKEVRKTIIRLQKSICEQKTTPKNTLDSKNESILKINGQNWPRGKGVCKMISLGQKLKMPKRCEE